MATIIRKFVRDEDTEFTSEELSGGSFRIYDSKMRLAREILDRDELMWLLSSAKQSGFREVTP